MDNKKPKLRFKGFTDDWEQRKLNDYISLRMGHLFSPNDYVKNGKYDVITIVNVKGDRLVDKANVNTIDILPNNINDYQILKDGDMLISLTGNIGRVSYNYGNNSVLNYRVGKIEFNKYKINDKFVYSYLSKESVLNELIQKGQGGAQPNISKPELENLSIKVTNDYSEQQNIGDLFEKIDNLITLHQRKYNKLLNIKKSLLEKMFPKNGSNIPEIRFKEFTDAWEQRKFGDVGYISMCKRIFKNETTEKGEVPFYKIGTFGEVADAFISYEKYEFYKSKFAYPNKGDILLSASGTIGRIVEYNGEKAYFQDSNIVWLNHNSSIINSFLKVLYPTVKWDGIEGSTIKRLYNSNFLNTEFYMPSNDEQEKIGKLFDRLDNLITLHQRKYETLKNIKQSLLSKMFI